MATCPHCQTEVQGSFGLTPCPKCRQPLFFDFDGSLLQDPIEDTQEPLSIESLETPELLKLDGDFFEESSGVQTTMESTGSENPSELEVLEPLINPDEPLPLDNQENIIEPIFTLPTQSTGVFEDLQNFADQEPLSTWGKALYTIEISGIDSGEQRNLLLEELHDARLGWNSTELEGLISNGTLILNRITPVKASVVVTRLKSLSLKVTWHQTIADI